MSDTQPCLSCGAPIDRTIPNPIPEDYECMWTEAMTGRAHYCSTCYDEQPSEDQ